MEVLKKINKHEDLHKLDSNYAKEAAVISAMSKNDKVMGYINSGLVMIEEHRNCVSAAKSVKFPFGIAYLAQKELREYYIPDGTMTNASLTKILCNVTMKSKDPKDLGSEFIRVRSLFVEAGCQSDLVNQAVIALPGDIYYGDALIAVHKNANVPGNPTLKEVIKAAREKYEYSVKMFSERKKRRKLSMQWLMLKLANQVQVIPKKRRRLKLEEYVMNVAKKDTGQKTAGKRKKMQIEGDPNG